MAPEPLTVVLGTYLAPVEQVDEHRPAHKAFIEGLIAEGRVLVAGRTPDADGSVIVARGVDGPGALALLEQDPYVLAGVARYEAARTFGPVLGDPALASLLGSG